MVTPASKRVLDFMREYIRDNGYSPTYDEIRIGLGLNSVSTVSKHLDSLEAQGLVARRTKYSPRAIMLTELSDDDLALDAAMELLIELHGPLPDRLDAHCRLCLDDKPCRGADLIRAWWKRTG